jgi:hypothetical protein
MTGQTRLWVVVELKQTRGAKWRKLALPSFLTVMIISAFIQSDSADWTSEPGILVLYVVLAGLIIWRFWAALQPDQLIIGPRSLTITREGSTHEYRWVDIQFIMRAAGKVLLSVVGDRDSWFRKRGLVTLNHRYGTESVAVLTTMLREHWEAAIPDNEGYKRIDEAKDRRYRWGQVAVWFGIIVVTVVYVMFSS